LYFKETNLKSSLNSQCFNMQVLDKIKRFPHPTAVALGNFDGVHIGHARLIATLKSFGLESVVYTFKKHPQNVIFGEGSVLTVNTNFEKAKILDSLGIDTLVFDDFTRVRNMSPAEFVDDVIVGTLSAKAVVCGYNYRFGKGGEGDAKLLSHLLEEKGIHLTVIDEVTLDGVPVSSTAVRQALARGDMESAARLLGRPYFIDSTVVHGKALGRQLGFPTVNETFESGRFVLPYGVYFARCIIDGKKQFRAVVNVGVRPTVNSTDKVPTVEAHIIDFSGDLYGMDVRVEFMKKCRDEQKFDSLDALKAQIEKDIKNCREYFDGKEKTNN